MRLTFESGDWEKRSPSPVQVGFIQWTERLSEKKFCLSNCLWAGMMFFYWLWTQTQTKAEPLALPGSPACGQQILGHLSLHNLKSPFLIKKKKKIYLPVYCLHVCIDTVYVCMFCVHACIHVHIAHIHTQGRKRPWVWYGHAPASPCRFEADDCWSYQ